MLRRLLSELLALVAPPACSACRVPLMASDAALCSECRRALPWLPEARCPRCGLPGRCRFCPARGAAFSAAWAPLAHEGPARALVAALKFRGALPVADLMAAPMAAGVPRELLAGASIVPVPLHPARRRERGFDQAARLAAAVSRRTGRPVAPCLRRRGTATRQLGAGGADRLARGRIEVAVVGTPPERALLLDDVHTTGATLEACARALRAAGAREVVALTYSRTLRGA